MISANDKKALKSGVCYVFINIFIKFIGFISYPLFIRILSKIELGQFENFNSWLSILLPVFTLCFSSSITVAKFEYKEELDDYIKSILGLGTFVTFCFYLVYLFSGNIFENILKVNSLYIHVIFLYCMVAPAFEILQTKCRLEYNYKLSSLLSLIPGGAFIIITLVITYYSKNKLSGRIIGYYTPMILFCLIIYLHFFFKDKGIKAKYWKFALTVSVPLVFHTVSGSVLSLFDRIMINSIIGNEETALYSVAYSCAMIIEILWYSLNQAWAPWAYEKMVQNEGDILRKISKIYLISFGTIVVLFMLMSPEVLYIIGGESYVYALRVIPPVMCGFVFQLVYSLYVNIETLEKKTIYVAIGTVIASIINVFLNMFFLPRYGYVAASYTTLAGFIVLFCMHFFFVFKMKKTYWYDSKFNILYLLSVLCLTYIVNISYDFDIIRYSLITVIMILIIFVTIKYKDKINSFVHEILSNSK